MSRAVPLLLVFASTAGLIMFQLGCTVVTSCPSPQPSTGTPNGGSSSGGGGGSNGATGGIGSTGLPLANWTNVTSNLAGLTSECGNLSYVSAKPDEDMLIAGVAQRGLWSSVDAGQSWQQLGTGTGSDVITNRTTAIVYDPVHSAQFWESGLYNGGGVYLTADDGQVLTLQGQVVHSDLVAIDFTDPDRKTLLAGGHEQAQALNLSTDGGKNWNSIGGTLPNNTNCTRPLIIDSTTFLVGCAGYGGGVTGVYRSTDAGASWISVSTLGGGTSPLRASDGSIYWASPNSALARSTDDGQTWTQVTGPSVLTGLSPIELPDGRIAALLGNGGAVAVTADRGATWQFATAALPYSDPIGLAYSVQQKAFYIWRLDCTDKVPDNAIMRAEFDYEAK